MKNIVIINAYGYKNIGDESILESSLKILGQVSKKKNKMIVMCEEKQSVLKNIVNKFGITILQLPYGYAIRSKKQKASGVIKMLRFVEIISLSAFFVVGNKYFKVNLPSHGFYSYIHHLKHADIVIGMGGGYFTSKNPLTDTFGVVLSVIPIYVAKFYKKQILFLPISFGGFASRAHEKLTYNAISGSTVYLREDISLSRLKKLKKKKDKTKLIFVPDLALFYKVDRGNMIEKKMKSNYIVLTGREWMKKDKQIFYENELSILVDYLWGTYKLKTVFIPMAGNEIEDDDNRVGFRIKNSIVNKDIFTIYNTSDPKQVQHLLLKSRFAVCTRLHSAILATTVLTPYLAIAYNLKTEGFLKYYGLEEWGMNIEMVDFPQLQEMVEKLIAARAYKSFIKKMGQKDKENNIHLEILKQDLGRILN